MVVGQVADTAEACRGLPRAVILGEMHVGARTRWWYARAGSSAATSRRGSSRMEHWGRKTSVRNKGNSALTAR